MWSSKYLQQYAWHYSFYKRNCVIDIAMQEMKIIRLKHGADSVHHALFSLKFVSFVMVP